MPKANAWSREELDFLSEHYGKTGWNSIRIASEKPGPFRSPHAIRQKARYIGLADPEHIGNWKHDPAMYDDIYDLAVLDYTQDQIADSLYAQYGARVSGKWVARVMQKHLHPSVYKSWVSRASQRRSRGVTLSWKERAKHQDILDAAIEAAGSGAEVGRRLGVTKNTVCNWKKGRCMINERRLAQLKTIIEEQGHE